MWFFFAGVCLCEMINYIFYRIVVRFVSEKKHYDCQVNFEKNQEYLLSLSNDDLIEMIEHTICYNTKHKDKYKTYSHPKFQDIPRNNMIKWVSYIIYLKSQWQLDQSQHQHAETILVLIENKLNHKFKYGYSKNMYFLKFGNNHIKSFYKPLLIQTTLWIIKYMLYFILYIYGFKKIKSPKSRTIYWYYKNKNSNISTLFIHGIGFGIGPYFKFISQMMKQSSVLVPILPNISFLQYHSVFESLTHDKLFPVYQMWKCDIKYILNLLNIDKIHGVAHSFGTVVLSSLLKDEELNNKIQTKMFIDPICFIHKSHHIYRYIDEPYDQNNLLWSKILNQFIYQDIYIRYTTQRFLYGPEFWIYDLTNKEQYMIILSEKDVIIPVNGLADFFRKNKIKYGILSNIGHGEIFVKNKDYIIAELIKILFDRIKQTSDGNIDCRNSGSRCKLMSATTDTFSDFTNIDFITSERQYVV
jgi:hypothetical protein